MTHVEGDEEGETVVVSESRLGPFHLRVKAASATFSVDQPFGAGGSGAGPDPYDLLSAAIGSCSLMTMRLFADDRRWPLEKVSVRVIHRRDELRSQDRFLKQIELVGDLDDAQRTELVLVSTRCPVHVSVERGSIVETVLLLDRPVTDLAVSHSAHMRGMREAVHD